MEKWRCSIEAHALWDLSWCHSEALMRCNVVPSYGAGCEAELDVSCCGRLSSAAHAEGGTRRESAAALNQLCKAGPAL
jgi:hypothetical protein